MRAIVIFSAVGLYLRYLHGMVSSKHIIFLIALLSVLFFNACRDKEEEPVEEKPIQTEEERICEDACVFANDGECDDGGPGATSSYCDFGKDCTDCGKRVIIRLKK
jgi:hypothetical protein